MWCSATLFLLLITPAASKALPGEPVQTLKSHNKIVDRKTSIINSGKAPASTQQQQQTSKKTVLVATNTTTDRQQTNKKTVGNVSVATANDATTANTTAPQQQPAISPTANRVPAATNATMNNVLIATANSATTANTTAPQQQQHRDKRDCCHHYYDHGHDLMEMHNNPHHFSSDYMEGPAHDEFHSVDEHGSRLDLGDEDLGGIGHHGLGGGGGGYGKKDVILFDFITECSKKNTETF